MKPKNSVEWSDDEKFKLIKAVEKRPCLWDKGLAEYKLPKLKVWEEVVSEMERSDVKLDDCKALWSNLHITFNTNMAKHRAKKSGQGTDESCTIVWKFFRAMLFLEACDVRQSTASTSSMILVNFSCFNSNSRVNIHLILLLFVRFLGGRYQ